MNPIRYIFGCNHENRTIFSHTLFERGLVLPVAFCENCFDIGTESKIEEEN